MNKFLTVLISILIITGCGDDTSMRYSESHDSYGNSDFDVAEEMAVERKTSSQATTSNAIKPIEESKKIIKEGYMEVWAKDIQKPKARVDSLLQINGGYYSKETLDHTGSNSSYLLIIRVPAHVYEKLITGIETGPGEIFNKSINIKDITEEYLDIQTRLENKRRYIERYRELLKKANSIKEILEIDENIRTLEEEIESAEGRIRYLTDRVNYSTLQLEIHQYRDSSPTTSSGKRFFKRLVNSLDTGVDIFIEIILLIVTLWPLWIVGVILFYVIRRIRKKNSRS